MSEMAINNVRQLQEIELKKPQVDIETWHILHGGMYARTIMIPANTRLTGALIKIATVLIASGDFTVYINDEVIEKKGYHVFAASSGRKQAFIARTDTYLTMIFATNAKTVSEAEEQFTDESALLSSRLPHSVNNITITGE